MIHVINKNNLSGCMVEERLGDKTKGRTRLKTERPILRDIAIQSKDNSIYIENFVILSLSCKNRKQSAIRLSKVDIFWNFHKILLVPQMHMYMLKICPYFLDFMAALFISFTCFSYSIQNISPFPLMHVANQYFCLIPYLIFLLLLRLF